MLTDRDELHWVVRSERAAVNTGSTVSTRFRISHRQEFGVAEVAKQSIQFLSFLVRELDAKGEALAAPRTVNFHDLSVVRRVIPGDEVDSLVDVSLVRFGALSAVGL